MVDKSIFNKLYQKLNSQQKEAVDTLEGPILVVAGPGTGKTQIIALRIANILKKTQAGPESILALTFTESGAYAMKNRLNQIIGPESYKIRVYTFHGFCQEVINTFPEKFIFSNKLELIEDLEKINLVKKILEQKSWPRLKTLKAPHYFIPTIISKIDELKKENISPSKLRSITNNKINEIKNNYSNYHQKGTNKGKLIVKYANEIEKLKRTSEFILVYKLYNDLFKEKGLYDFNDLILFVLNKLKTDIEVKQYFQEQFLYLLVDEYQDTNSAQNEIIQLLTDYDPSPNIFAVGDDEQSIYRFQGAAIANIINFKEHFYNPKIIILKTNYRSKKFIIDSSRKMILNNKNQITHLWNIDKNFQSISTDVDTSKIELSHFDNGDIEDWYTIQKIKKLLKDGVQPQEIAVLYRYHRDAENITQLFIKHELPYFLETGQDIFNDFEIQKLIKIMEVIAFKGVNDDQNLFEIMHYEFFNLNTVDILKISLNAQKEKKLLFDYLIDEKWKKLDLTSQPNLVKFVNILSNLQAKARQISLADFFQHLIVSTGYYDRLVDLPDAVIHLENLNKLFEKIKLINRKNKKLNLEYFLNYLIELNANNLTLDTNHTDPNLKAVRLMTVHKAKGLEFEYVFIIHVTDSNWGGRSNRQLIKLPEGLIKYPSDDENIEEERRLFYVALTRAKSGIFISSAETYGDDTKFNQPASFINELSKEFINKVNPTQWNDKSFEILKNKFAPLPIHKSNNFDKYLQRLIEDYVLNPTGLNAYIKCPKYFLYNNLLHIPQTKTFEQSYGTAIHKALEEFFTLYKKNHILPDQNSFVRIYIENLNNEVLIEKDFVRAKEIGGKIIKKYYDFYKSDWRERGIPLFTEFNFSSHHVYLKDIPITGKIDKIQLIDSIANTLEVVDYKTSKPKSLNQIKGQTKTNDRSLLNQLLFYKILADEDKLFRGIVTKLTLDFVLDENNKFIRRTIEPTHNEIEEMKNLIIQVFTNIKSHKFNHDNLSDKQKCQWCKDNAPVSMIAQLNRLNQYDI